MSLSVSSIAIGEDRFVKHNRKTPPVSEDRRRFGHSSVFRSPPYYILYDASSKDTHSMYRYEEKKCTCPNCGLSTPNLSSEIRVPLKKRVIEIT
jgi:hypothetical protein